MPTLGDRHRADGRPAEPGTEVELSARLVELAAPLVRGAVPIQALVDRLSERLALAVQCPLAADAGRPAEERARNLARATLALFAARAAGRARG